MLNIIKRYLSLSLIHISIRNSTIAQHFQSDRIQIGMAHIMCPPQLWVAHLKQPGDLLLPGAKCPALLNRLHSASKILGCNRPTQDHITGLGRVQLAMEAYFSGYIAGFGGIQTQGTYMHRASMNKLNWQPDAPRIGGRVKAIPCLLYTSRCV